MTRERREEVLLVALVVSVAVHVGLMLLVRPQVMSRASVQLKRTERRTPMHMTEARGERPDPVRIEEILDLKAVKDAPAVQGDETVPAAEAPVATTAAAAARAPQPSEPVELKGPAISAPVFEVKTVGREPQPAAVLPLARIETPSVAASQSAPEFSVRMPASVPEVKPTPAPRVEPSEVLLAEKLPPTLGPKVEAEAGAAEKERRAFTPAEEVYEKVDEKVVADEKAAVRELVDAPRAGDLTRVVGVSMTAVTSGAWRYFRVRVEPKADLKVVPKDVVLIIDGSGSIGNDRLGSCRAAARRILRTCTNSGDRFNLVVFRNAFSYAFRSWQPCEAASFAAGDKWLTRQTAHGRTDVFSTISSVLTLPRDPSRPLVALVVTDGDANAGVSDTSEIISRFTALNDGLVSVYMYGVKSAANRELIDVLTHGNRGESFIYDGWRWKAGDQLDALSERFRDPVLSDCRLIFATDTPATAFPRALRNLCRGNGLTFVGRVPATASDVAFSLRGLNGSEAYEGFFRLPFASAPVDRAIVGEWLSEVAIDGKLGNR